MRWQRSPMIFAPIFGPAYTSKTSNWPKKQQRSPGNDNQSRPPYRIALEAIRALHFGSVRGDMTFISSTPGKIKKGRVAWRLIILPKTAAAPGSSKSLEAIAGCPLDVVFAGQASLLYR